MPLCLKCQHFILTEPKNIILSYLDDIVIAKIFDGEYLNSLFSGHSNQERVVSILCQVLCDYGFIDIQDLDIHPIFIEIYHNLFNRNIFNFKDLSIDDIYSDFLTLYYDDKDIYFSFLDSTNKINRLSQCEINIIIDTRNKFAWEILCLLAENLYEWIDILRQQNLDNLNEKDEDQFFEETEEYKYIDIDNYDMSKFQDLIDFISKFPNNIQYDYEYWKKITSSNFKIDHIIDLGIIIYKNFDENQRPGWLNIVYTNIYGYKESVFSLVNANLRLVIKPARRYSQLGCEFNDLIQVGILGLIKGCSRYEYGTASLSTYVSFWIQSFISRYIRDMFNTIRIPVHRIDKCYDNSLPWEKGWELYGDIDLPYAEFPLWLNINKIDLIKNDLMIPIIRYRIDISDENEQEHYFTGHKNEDLNPENESIKYDLAAKIHLIVDGLKENEKIVITRRFGLDGNPTETLEEIGQSMGVTRERIRQIEAKALLRLGKRLLKLSEDIIDG